MDKRVKDISGQRFGRLTVLEFVSPGAGKSAWKVRCDCGVEKVVDGSGMRKGSVRSCGCLRREMLSAHGRKNVVKMNLACGKIGGVSSKLAESKRNATKRSLAWSLTDAVAISLLTGPCLYCGIEPVKSKTSRVDPVKTNGIDRVDNSIGYEPGNVVSCCKECNMAKSSRSKADFLSWVSRIAQHQGFNTYNPPPIQEDQSMKWTVM